MTVLLVALGSALGGVCRYGVSTALAVSSGFPWGTLGVNVFGSLLIGLLSGWLARGVGPAAAVRAFAVVGFCGGFTTFSTFSNETLRLVESARWGAAAGYVVVSAVGGLLAVWLGSVVAKGV